MTTTSGASVDTDLILVAAGISPNTSLAAAAGLEIEHGILVDDGMRTSDPSIYAAGDVAQFRGRTWGLWSVATAQAEVAALNAIGGSEIYEEEHPVTLLKGAGIDVTTFGCLEPQPADEVTIDEDRLDPPRYQKVIRRNGSVVGGIFINSPDACAATLASYDAVAGGVDTSPTPTAVR